MIMVKALLSAGLALGAVMLCMKRPVVAALMLLGSLTLLS